METIGGTIGFVQGAKRVRANAMEVEVIAPGRCTVTKRSRTVATRAAIVPIVFVQPSVPSLVHEIAGA